MTGRPLPLAEVGDEQVFGGKAAALGTAVREGLPVPAGVALSVHLVAALAGAGSAGEAARARVREAAEELGGPLAARSSAVGEDGAASSFAGQHLTVLNVRPVDVVAVVLRIAASSRSESALAYRRARGALPEPACGVVLQRLVPAETAGVAFSADPVTGADEVVVEASWALGEAVVDGLVVPDLFRLAPDGRVLTQVVGRKDRAVVPRPGGGTTTVAVPPERARRPCLEPADLAALAALARTCDRVFGGPSDVEWAAAGGAVSLLQRRPITTLG
ncbi:PEP/pyruvate-binding domain-containing protein [Trujillonella endophytica]|uniref:Pyruvate phosphate dikinase, PEP/pyruvate binding domain n=1 Tax=Trujillonella endophytica TaxID=673521 RepID=A0A1H8V3J8_9ACTN|nr:PEP/pyruvate-binding domain-containing protein [Trujillella endophytica]SEP09971.1 Pyruvate phosphate dikinase, PEP/pyruvate binding domain [Trujillella endophytica]